MQDADNRQAALSNASPAQPTLLYTWVEQIHSVNFYPDSWEYPLRLALGTQDHTVVTHGISTSDLPHSLPISCGKAYDHSWRLEVCCFSASLLLLPTSEPMYLIELEAFWEACFVVK